MVHLSNHLCDFVRLARKATHTQLAISQLGQLSHVLKSARPGTELASPAWSARLQLEEAETLWAWDERTLAIHALRKTAIYAEQEPSVSVAPILCLLGKYIGAERVSWAESKHSFPALIWHALVATTDECDRPIFIQGGESQGSAVPKQLQARSG